MAYAIFSNLIAGVRTMAAGNAALWQAFKANLDTYLNQDYANNPGGIYEASELEMAINYALGYAALNGTAQQATANNYANRAVGFIANAVGASWCLPAWQKQTWLNWQPFGTTDGTSTSYPLTGFANVIGSSITLNLGQPVTLSVTRASGADDEVDGIIYSYVTDIFQGSTHYVEGVDWFQPADSSPEFIQWYPGHGPATNTTYSVVRVFCAGGQTTPQGPQNPSTWQYNAGTNSIVFTNPPAAGQIVMAGFLYGNYQQTSFRDGGRPNNGKNGGFNSILIDGPGYTGRYLGKGVAMVLDLLQAGLPGGFAVDATCYNNAVALLQQWFTYITASGQAYFYGSPSSNYDDGYEASNVCTALVLANLGVSSTQLANVIAYRNSTVVPTLQQANAGLQDGFWREGSYGDLAIRNLLLGSLALEAAGDITATVEHTWAGQAALAIIQGSTTNAIADEYETWFSWPVAQWSKTLLQMLSSTAATADPTNAALAAYVAANWPLADIGTDYFTMLFTQGMPSPATDLSAVPLQRNNRGANHYNLRSNRTFNNTGAATGVDVVVRGMCGNFAGCDHQEYSPGQLAIWRGPDALLVDGTAVADAAYLITQRSQYNNCLIIDSGADDGTVQQYAYNMGFWYGSPGVSLVGVDGDGVSWASVVENYPTAYAPASPGDGTGGPVSALTRQQVFIVKDATAGKAYHVVYDRVTKKKPGYFAGVNWLSTANWTTAAITGGRSFQSTVGHSTIFGQTLSGQALTYTGTVPVIVSTTLQGVQLSNSAVATLSILTIFQVEPSTTSTPDTMGRFVSQDGLSEGAVAGSNALVFCQTPTGVTYNSSIQGMATNYVFGMTPLATYTVNGAPVTANQCGTLVFNSTGQVLIAKPSATPLLMAIAEDSMWFDVVGARW